MRCPQCHRRLPLGAACPVHGVQATQTARPQPENPAFEGYELLSHLGQGGFADVYAARSIADGTEVAIKVGIDGVQERFAREAAALARLAGGVAPRLVAHGQLPQRRPYLVLELIKGQSLAQLLTALPGAGALPAEEAL